MRVVYEGLPPRAFSLDAILKGLSEPLSLVHGSPEAYLTEGILASQAAPAWLRVGSRGREVMRQDGPEVECWRSAEGGPEKAELELSTLLPGSVVRARCAFSPVPIWLGGVQLEPGWREPYLLGFQRWGGGSLRAPAERKPLVRVGSDGPLAGDELFLEQTVGDPLWDSLLAVPLSLTGSATVDWVLDGVVIAQESLDLGCPGARIVAAASTLTTDLTRFRVIHDTAHAARLEELKQRVSDLLEAMSKHRQALQVPQDWPGPKDSVVGGLVVGSAAALGLVSLTNAPLVLLAACLLVPGAGWLAYHRGRTHLDEFATQRVKDTLWPEK